VLAIAPGPKSLPGSVNVRKPAQRPDHQNPLHRCDLVGCDIGRHLDFTLQRCIGPRIAIASDVAA
jgi:hypothetical protein